MSSDLRATWTFSSLRSRPSLKRSRGCASMCHKDQKHLLHVGLSCSAQFTRNMACLLADVTSTHARDGAPCSIHMQISHAFLSDKLTPGAVQGCEADVQWHQPRGRGADSPRLTQEASWSLHSVTARASAQETIDSISHLTLHKTMTAALFQVPPARRLMAMNCACLCCITLSM